MEIKDWLIVESFDNWRIDKKNEFSYFGITERFHRLKDQLKVGDRLFTYVSKKSAFSDIREVIKDGLRKLPMGGDYEKSLPYCIDTRPVVVLPPEKWILMSEIKDRFKLISGQPHWSALFQSAPRRLDRSDALMLTELMLARTPEINSNESI